MQKLKKTLSRLHFEIQASKIRPLCMGMSVLADQQELIYISFV